MDKISGWNRNTFRTFSYSIEMGLKSAGSTLTFDMQKTQKLNLLHNSKKPHKTSEKNMFISQVDLEIGSSELDLIKEAIDERWLSEGKNCARLSEKVSDFLGAKFVTFAPNGTLGLFLALLASGIERDSEIIIPSFSFYASATAPIFAGLKPVFVDVCSETFNVNIEAIERAISEKTKAIMPVHCYGHSADMSSIISLAKKYGLFVIEDAAQAFGITFENHFAGTMGDVGVFSFYSDKIITMGEGALVVTDNEKLFEKINLIRNQGRLNSGSFIHEELGMNFRITDLQAAIGLSQINKFSSILNRRLYLWQLYYELLDGTGDIRFMKINASSNLVPFRFPIRTKHKNELSAHLEKSGIQTRSFFYPLHKQTKLKKYRRVGKIEVSSELYKTGICLPIHAHISDENVKYICRQIKEFFYEK